MRIPKGFIKDSEGVYRRGSFVFKNNKIYKESLLVPKSTVEELADNYVTASECIRAILAFPAAIGEKPRTTDVYVDKVGNGFKQSNKFSKNTVAIVTSDRNVIEIKAKDISDSTDFNDLINKDKADKPVDAKEIKNFSSDKPKDSQEVITASLKESYSDKLGGEPEDFISDVNDILAHIKSFNKESLATKRALQELEDFETKLEDAIDTVKMAIGGE